MDDEFDVQSFARDIHELLILASLRQEAKHGYQIAMDVEEDSNGLVRFRHGTLYPILHRLEKEGQIRGTWSREGGRRRKIYALTSSGRRHLEGRSGQVDRIMTRLMAVLRPAGEATA